MSLPSRLLLANPGAQVSTVLTGALTTQGAKQAFVGEGYESIATATGTGSSGVITFSSIPSTFQHLQIRAIMRNTVAAYDGSQNIAITFNSDTGANYSHHHFFAREYGDTGVSETNSTTNINVLGTSPSDGVSANTFGTFILDLLDYKNTSKYKTTRTFFGCNTNGTTNNMSVGLSGGVWMSTTAVSTITLTSGSGSWKTNSHFALYGIKGI